MKETFRKFAHRTSEIMGSYWAFCIAVLIIIVWATTGPIFHFSEAWQLFINTGTTIVTFLMVFLVQNAQNRDGRATQLKLDELIYAIKKARDKFIDAEEFTDEELEKYTEALRKVAEKRTSQNKSKEKKD